MVIEVLIIFLALIALVAVIKSVFFIPWYLAVPYDDVAKEERR
ncbi:MAG: hypothetical protein AABY78_01500 [Nitrospirota bacterium]